MAYIASNPGIPSPAQRVLKHPVRFIPSLRTFLIGSFLLAGMTSARGQNRIIFDHLTVENGLSQGTVNCIFQDRQGFMWFGTQDGLNRFDGEKFKIFRPDPSVDNSLSDNFVTMIAEDSAGTLWIGFVNNPAIVNRYDPATESFTEIAKDSVDLSDTRISADRTQYLDPAGILWVATKGGGLKRVDRRTGQTTEYKHDPSRPKSILSDDVFSVVGDSSGFLWVGTREGLERFDPGTGTFEHFRHSDRDPHSLSESYVWPLLCDQTGVLWVGTFGGGLNRFDRRSGTFTGFQHNESDPASLAGNQIYSLYQDRGGMIWIGTAEHGVDRFHPELASRFSTQRHDPSNLSSLVENNVLGMTVSRTGSVWIGTRGGLDRWDRNKKTFTHFQHSESNPSSISGNQIQALLEDRSGSLWVGTVRHGLNRLNRSTGGFTRIIHDPAKSNSISGDRIYALLEDKSGSLWVGTYGEGLNLFDRKTQSFKVYRHVDTVASSLGAPGIWALLEDREGAIWVGTVGAGVDRFDRDSETFTHFPHDDRDPGSLSNNFVLCLFEDGSGSLWVGTAAGLNRLDRKSGTFQRYYEKDGLINDVVFGIMEDEEGNLWMSTNKGISKLAPDRRTFRNYDATDGLQSNEFNQNAYAKDPRTGEMFFGGPGGFSVFHPEKVKDYSYIPPVMFTSFTRYNSDDEEGKPIEEKGLSVKKEITLSYKDNVASFEFAALSFLNSYNNQYAYRLEGFSDNWIQLGTERKATFTNLDGGEYTLFVRGSNSDGIWNEKGTSLKITVNPPWWKTRWAYASYIILIIGFLYAGRRFELNQKEQKAKMREAELHAKASEAEKRALQAENERQTKELEDARLLQLSMLPKSVPDLPEYEIAVYMKTATEVGGDYYDFSLAADGTLNVAFGDATGHGMQAGTIVTLMKGLFLSDAARFDIQTFFNHCSKAIKEIKLGRLFMAFTLVRLKGNSVSLSSAGMPPAYLYKKRDGSVEEILLKGMPLGSMKNFPYALHESRLEQGDSLLLLTDGLPEQKNIRDEMFDYARIEKAFTDLGSASPKETIDRLMKAGEAWMEGAVQDDDITLLVIKKKA